MMYVYLRTEPALWTVGSYNPDGGWMPESDHSDREQAARRVAWLNGNGAVTLTAEQLATVRGALADAQAYRMNALP